MNEYVKHTECFHKNKTSSQFYLIYGKPNGEAGTASISRWLCDVLQGTGIDVTIFESHCTRSASASAAKSRTNLDMVMKAGRWCCPITFTRYYDLKVTPKM